MSFIEIFKRVDRNKDGKISRDEFAEVIHILYNGTTLEEINTMFRVLDKDSDGQINASEFASCFVNDKIYDEETLIKETFDLYDINRDGKISASEIREGLLKHHGEVYSMEECVAMIQVVDEDGDGFISFEEFKTRINS